MPQFRLIDTEIDHHLHAHLWSVMTFPKYSQLREQSEIILRFTMEIDDFSDENNMVVTAGDLRRLARSMSEAELRKMRHQAIKRGSIAGGLLLIMYLMDLFNIKDPSMNKAIYLLQRGSKDHFYGDGESLKSSEKTIRKYWKEYKPVAHLWGALELNNWYHLYDPVDLLTGKENITIFLRMSAALLDFGKDLIPSHSKSNTPLLDYLECWTLPKEIETDPYCLDPEKAKFPSLLKTYLKDYKLD